MSGICHLVLPSSSLGMFVSYTNRIFDVFRVKPFASLHCDPGYPFGSLFCEMAVFSSSLRPCNRKPRVPVKPVSKPRGNLKSGMSGAPADSDVDLLRGELAEMKTKFTAMMLGHKALKVKYDKLKLEILALKLHPWNVDSNKPHQDIDIDYFPATSTALGRMNEVRDRFRKIKARREEREAQNE